MNLERQDLIQIDSISNTCTLKLLPLGKKNKQKLVVGDDTSTLSCYEFKKGEPQIVFQSKLPEKHPITCVALGGSSDAKKDKIFCSYATRVVGYTKKGKEFFKLSVSLTESISNIIVEDTRIWAGCEYVYSVYDDGKDSAFYMSKDVIRSLAIDYISRETETDAILGCQDDCIRIIQGSSVFKEVHLAAAVTALTSVTFDTPKVRKGASEIAYGLINGTVGIIQMGKNGEYNYMWSLEDPKRGKVTCMRSADITKDGTVDIIVGRDDGRVEVIVPDDSGNGPGVVFSKNIGESVRSVECGVVSSVDFNEVVVAAYSGKVLSFTTEPVNQRAKDDTYGRSVQSINNENRMKVMRKELDELKKKVEKEKEKIKKAQAKSSVPVAEPTIDFSIIQEFSFDKEKAAYVLTIELQYPIDIVILRSCANLEIVETVQGSSTVSVTPSDILELASTDASLRGEAPGGDVVKFVAALQPSSAAASGAVAAQAGQVEDKRISVLLHTQEGQHSNGDIVVTVVAATKPKAAKLFSIPLKPLSLHHKVNELDEASLARPKNKVTFTGTVAMSVLHEWLQTIFPDMSPSVPEGAVEQKYLFVNAYTRATTTCEYRKNSVVIESESPCVIALVKEAFTKLANFRRVALDESVVTDLKAIEAFLSLIRERLEHQLRLTQQMEILDALQEITMQEASTPWLDPKYVDMLNSQEDIRSQFKGRAKSLETLSHIITSAFVDWHHLNGADVKRRIPELEEFLLSSQYTFDKLLSFFQASRAKSNARR